MPRIPPRNPPRAGAPTKLANFRTTLAERAHINALAKAAGLTFSAYVRSCIPGLASVVSAPPQPTEDPPVTT